MKIIATHSFRGGSGKTFIALNMAAVSARAGIKTLVMDCDFGSPSFQSNLTYRTNPTFYGNDFLLGTCTDKEVISETNISNLDVIYADPKPVLGEGLLEPSEKIHWAALQHFSELRASLEEQGYQRLFLDTSPELTFSSASALTIADSIIIVHRPTIHSLSTTIYILQTIFAALRKSLKPREFYLIYNQVPHGSTEKVNKLLDTLTEKFRKSVDLTVLGQITLNPTMDFWDTLLVNEDSPTFKNLEQIGEFLF
jgi:chromosome partitioning protein